MALSCLFRTTTFPLLVKLTVEQFDHSFLLALSINNFNYRLKKEIEADGKHVFCVRENEESQRELRDLEAFVKRENAERKSESDAINKVLNAENDKRMKEAAALKDKMEKEKREMQVKYTGLS